MQWDNWHDCNLVPEGKDAIERCMVYSKYSFLLKIPINEFNNAVETIWVKISELQIKAIALFVFTIPNPTKEKMWLRFSKAN